MNRTLQYIGIAALIYFAITSAGSAVAERLKIGKIRFRIQKFDLSGLHIKLFLPVLNQTPIPLPYDRFSGTLSYGPYKIADVNVVQGKVLSPGQEINNTIDVRVPYENLLGTVAGVIGSRQFLNGLFLKGQLVSKNIVIPINQNIQVL